VKILDKIEFVLSVVLFIIWLTAFIGLFVLDESFPQGFVIFISINFFIFSCNLILVTSRFYKNRKKAKKQNKE